MGMLEIGLQFEGVQPQTLQALQEREDDINHIVTTVQVIWPRVDRAAPDVLHIIANIQALWPRISRTAPVVLQALREVLEHQKQQT